MFPGEQGPFTTQMEDKTVREKKTVLVFPGQGAQTVGMGADVVDALPEARELWEQADALLGMPLSDMIRNGPAEALVDTAVQQPALVLTSLVCLRGLECAAHAAGKKAPQETACASAGLSLGEYAALAAAQALSFADALKLVRRRGELMKAASARIPCGMAVVLNLDPEKIETACRQAAQETGGVIAPANFNGGGQIVIAGEEEALAQAMSLCKALGARRVMKLPVSGAFHTTLMQPAVDGLAEALSLAIVSPAVFPVYANAGAAPVCRPNDIRASLLKQLTSPVLWEQTIKRFAAEGCERFVEIGAGQTLAGMIRRITPNIECLSLSTWNDIRTFVETL
jgi:[acyl-carrier-protein] S-malonyltransferase